MIDSQQNQLEQLVAENTLLKQRVDQMQRLTALGELVSTTTHEFNNVLMTILNYAKMGMRHRDDATRDKALDKIYTAAERANKITNSVLGMARNRSNQFETTDMVKLIEQTMVLLERELSKYRISVELQIEEVPQIQAIGNQLQQVLLNLLINARQAMPDGGQLIVRLYADDQFVNLAVRDFGTGIPQDKLKKIFQPYFSTKDGPDESGKGGTGLGLASCKNIIEAHGGKIRVESMVGKGTCFTLKLPTGQKRPSPLVAANGLSAAAQPMNASAAE
ncbi:MAG: HAMP domain-containing sensor histidine kinase [Mariniblastus sp.]|nr:HAMP domain-containing sensor histidine kinase [Mariniblastus sp.]